MKYVKEYLETVVKIKPLGELTTKEDELYDMSGEMVYIDGKCSDIFISHADYANWLEKQDKIDKVSYEIAEKEKREFVGDGFIKCYSDFQDFKEGDTYWLEYVGNDNYNVRSDNLLGKMYHITPCQLYTIFKKQTWLEKQGEQKSVDDLTQQEAMDIAVAKCFEQGEHKPIDKVEPKFKVGDWVAHNKTHFVFKILKITPFNYEVVNQLGYHHTITNAAIENNYHLWTIQDAKDGDVLSYRDGQWIFIYKDKFDDSSFCYHTLYSTIHQDLTINDAGFTLLSDAILPATKEQRDLLFQKMKEAGYTFDFEKKELKKIEQKSAWSEEDERLCSCIIEEQEKSLDNVKNSKYGHSEIISDLKEMYRERIDWLKSLKQRIGE